MSNNQKIIDKDTWYALNDLISVIYTSPIDTLLSDVLNLTKKIVPFSHSLYYLFKHTENGSVFFNLSSSDIPTSYIDSYIEKYSKFDFINWYTTNCVDTDVFRESDLITDDVFNKSLFAQNWMIPAGLYHGVGAMIADENQRYGAIFVYRGENEENFTDKELAIIKIIDNHLLIRFSHLSDEEYKYLYLGKNDANDMVFQALSKREKEIIDCILNGTYRSELCDKLFITENTLNKHLDNIYKKLSINSFEELLRITTRNRKK